jgi:imidazolonepropionase-like amidohydrolase
MNEFYECHCHIALDGVDFRKASAKHKLSVDLDYVKSILKKYSDAGIAYVRDGGDKWGVSSAASKIAPEYGVEYTTPAFPIFKKGNYGGFLGKAFETPDEYRRLVMIAKQQGADFIKIMASGIMDFDAFGRLTGFPLTESELQEMVRIAHGEGFPVMIHVNSADGVKSAVAAGADSIEHGNYVDEAALSDMASAGCVWVPTVAATADLIGLGLFNDDMLKKILNLQRENIALGWNKGVIIAPGSDAGTKGVEHCTGLADEVKILISIVDENTLLQGQECIKNTFAKRI